MDPESIQDLFQELGSIHVRRMFGGMGLYCGGEIFGIEAKGDIYLKTDATNRAAFEEAGSCPFTYEKGGKATPMSYWLLPATAVDDPSEAARWGRIALEATRRAAAAKASKRKRT